MKYSKFSTEISVRPSDIDINGHVHYSKYLDYLLAARYDQMSMCYKLSMEKFLEMGYSWVATTTHIDFKRPINLGETAVVSAQIDSINGAQVKLNFWIEIKEKNKIAAEGYAIYTMISVKTGRPVRIPDEIIQKYSI